MFKALVIIGALNAPAVIQIEDDRGPYSSTLQCYTRGAEMIRDVAVRMPIAYASAICISVKKPEPPKLKSNGGETV